MKDIQSQIDTRNINIKKVGVKTVSYPITVRDKARKTQHTVATANMYVNLPHKFKGTHMSRFVEILNEFHGEFDINSFGAILKKMKERLDAEASHLELEFPYFLQKIKNGNAPILGNYRCAMHGSLQEEGDLVLTVDVPITLPLLEKKAQSLPGSHGSWGQARVRLRFNQFFWIEDIIHLIEDAVEVELEKLQIKGSTLLSVESLSRTISTVLSEVNAVSWFSVTVENFGDQCSTFSIIESATKSN